MILPRQRPRIRSALSVTILSSLLAAVALVMFTPEGGDRFRADDREELGKVLKTIPANGPFWKYGNVVMSRRARKAGMQPVIFPHWRHRALYTCRVCHMELGFSMKSGDTGITRMDYTEGKYCGACHDGKTAFTVQGKPGSPDCVRCHIKDTGPLEARFEQFANTLPMASFGNGIDWADALRNEYITPKNALKAKAKAMQLPDKLKKPLRLSSGAPRSDVLFSHDEHFQELDCSSCHPEIFNIKKMGTQSFSMENNLFGNFCGSCHMLVAFPMNDCKRCHPSFGSSGIM